MSSGTKLIQNAYRLIGAHSNASPADPESIALGRDALNDMLQQWESDNIVIGVSVIDDAADELGEPADTKLAIEQNLAILAAPLFDDGKGIVSVTLATNARLSYQRLKRSGYLKVTIGKKVISSTTPKGAGHSRYGRKRFFDQGDTISN